MRSKMTADEIRNSNSLEAQIAARAIADGTAFIPKSSIVGSTATLDQMGRSYYIFCIEQALVNIQQARAIVGDDAIEQNHELARIERLLSEAIDAS